MDIALLVIGVASEFVGIVLLGFPDFLPGAIRLSGWLGRQTRRAANLMRRIFRRQQRRWVVSADMATSFEVAMRVSGIAKPGPDVKTVENKVEYLLRRDEAAQRELNGVAVRVGTLEKESPEQLAEARQEMERHFSRELTDALEAYRPLRVAGTVALAIGLGCVTAATFIA